MLCSPSHSFVGVQLDYILSSQITVLQSRTVYQWSKVIQTSPCMANLPQLAADLTSNPELHVSTLKHNLKKKIRVSICKHPTYVVIQGSILVWLRIRFLWRSVWWRGKKIFFLCNLQPLFYTPTIKVSTKKLWPCSEAKKQFFLKSKRSARTIWQHGPWWYLTMVTNQVTGLRPTMEGGVSKRARFSPRQGSAGGRKGP